MSDWVEGLFNIDLNLNSRGENVDALVEKFQGALLVNSKKGTLHIKKGARSDSINTVARLSKLLKASSGVLGILDIALGNKGGGETSKLKEYADILSIVPDLSELFEKISFHGFDLKARRDKELDLIFDHIRVDGTNIALQGTGGTAYREGVPIVDQTLVMDLQLYVREAVAIKMARIIKLSGERDSNGYIKAYNFPVDGTLNKPNFHVLDHLMQGVNNLKSRYMPGQNKDTAPTQNQQPPAKPEDALKKLFKLF